MTVSVGPDRAEALSTALQRQGFSPYFGTPCGILAPLYQLLESKGGLLTVVREDNAVGVAAGSAMAGRSPVVLMQNSGLGQSVNAIASLVVPYRVPMLFVIGMRGTDEDSTSENEVMGRLTETLLSAAGIPSARLEGPLLEDQVAWCRSLVVEQRRPTALLIPPASFGWCQ
ncbi:thiamine pyrophosphate-binding protein [Streptomyces canus]|uniref:thiamine pyrophosphate-binding protein n=1 Tax=Streptomyces canus TaxID=58343 RepID=UPI0033F59A51